MRVPPDALSALPASRRPRRWRRDVLVPLATAGLAVLIAGCSSAPTERLSSASGSTNRGYHTKLDGWGPQQPPAGFPRFIDHSVGQEEISMQAMGLVGVPYRWGGNTPASGFDCSGLVRYVVERAAQINLPRTTGGMSKAGVSISPSEIAPGDLIFFNTDGGRPYSHVGVYVGDYRFVNAPSTGGTVRIDYVTNPYWARHFDGIRRVAGLGKTPILDTPIAPSAPPQSIMPQRALASNDSAADQTRLDDANAVAARSDAVTDAPHTTTSSYPAASQSIPASVGNTTREAVSDPGNDPIAATIARSNTAPQPSPPAAYSARPSYTSADEQAARVRSDAAIAQQAANSTAADDPIARIASRGY